MMPDGEIFAAALELPASERPAFLARVCADDAVRRSRLERLLAAHAASAAFLAEPPTLVGENDTAGDAQPGDRIGRHVVVGKLGEGGCGVVYLAEQQEPVRRRVALKVIKPGMDSRHVIARFEAERQALALMEHPDIARVYDAGTTAAGRPFFAMEFVDGVAITRFCDEQNLTLTARLELFARVCLALQHAHQKGVVHRDLKPSNVLVALQDGVPAPKVIDFGIAKATQGPLADAAVVTSVEQFLGTPAHMSPEQAERRDVDIDTRSDIYSLGVLLYELLAGRPPFDPQELVRAGLDEIRRIIREVDPPRPSARFATLAEADRTLIGRSRRSAPGHLNSTLRGDLDWIVMRCLEKERARRYDTARELADDVRRHLRREPVSARPPSAAYRVQRFVARHRFACLSAAAVALALVLGTVISVRQAVRATRAERVALAERDAAAAARADALRRQGEAEDLLAFMLGDFRGELKKLGRLNLLDAVGAKALAYFAALDPRDLTDTALTRQAKALTQIGETRMDQARYAEALEACTTAQTRAAALAARHPRDADALFERAQAEYWIGFVARKRGDFAGAREWLTRYRDSALALAALEGPTTRAREEVSYGHHNLAVLAADRGELAVAASEFRAEADAVRVLLEAKPGDTQLSFRLSDVASWRASIAERGGNFGEAHARFEECIERLDELRRREPAVMRWQFRCADSLLLRGNLRLAAGEVRRAEEDYAQAAALLAAVRAHDPANRLWRVIELNLGLQRVAIQLAAGRAAESEASLGELRAGWAQLAAAEPTAAPMVARLAMAWRLEAWRRWQAGQQDAGEAVERAIATLQPLVAELRADEQAVSEFAQACVLAAHIARGEARDEVWLAHAGRALAVLGARIETSRDWRFLVPAARALSMLGRSGEAQPLIERLREIRYRPADPAIAAELGLSAASLSSPQP